MQLNQESTDYLVNENQRLMAKLAKVRADALDGDVADHVPVTHSRYDCVDDRQLTLF